MASAIVHCQNETGFRNDLMLECIQRFNDSAFIYGIVIPIILMFLLFIGIVVFAVLVSKIDKDEYENAVTDSFGKESDAYGTR